MNSSLDPKFFQVLPTRSLSCAPTNIAGGTLQTKTRSSVPVARKKNLSWPKLRERIAALRPDFSEQQLTTVSDSLQEFLNALMKENWQRAKQVIAHATGEAQAISIIGPLSEPTFYADKLTGEIEDATLEEVLQRIESGVKLSVADMKKHVSPLSLATKSLADLEPALDEMEKTPDRPSALDYACITVVKALVRERCRNLIASVRHKIEKDLSFELAATTELVKAPSPTISTVMNDDVVNLATQALHEDNIDAIVELLARVPNFAADVVRDALNGRNARAITALAWKAGLPASLATAIQIHLALVPPTRAIQPASDGISYALTSRELNWQLDFLREKCMALAV